MTTMLTVTPGQRDRLARLGARLDDLGRIVNKTPTIAPKNVHIPKNSDELAEMIADQGKMAPVLSNQETFRGWIDAYAEQRQGEGTDIHRMVAEETQRQLADFVREKDLDGDNTERINRLNLNPQNKSGGKRMLASYGQGAKYNPNAPGVVLDNKFRDSVDYLEAIWHLNESPEASARRTEIRNAASSVSPADGGFLVPETLRSQLLEIALETATVRPRATVVPMDSARVPFPTIDVSSNQSSVFGGMIAYWGEESAALVDSNPKFSRVELDAKKLTGLSVVPNELLQDSLISFSALIERLWPMALSFQEDGAFTAGSGVGEPLGYLGNPASVAVAAEGGQDAATINYFNIVNMYARMLPSSLQRAAWVVSPDAIPQLLTMSLSVGTGGNSVFVANAAGSAPMSIFGRPIIVTEQANRLGVQGDIAFVDLTYYLVGDRQQMTAASSTDWKFGNDQTAYRIIQRVDGQPWIKNPITPKNGGNALSPFVELAAR
jgi:HK97 family phage major capsid protein